MSKKKRSPGWNEGDVFALLSEGETRERAEWQKNLQKSLGGTCTSPLHITCQKATPVGDRQLADLTRIFLDILLPVGPLAIEGKRVELWYSAYRTSGIVKCLVPVGDALERALAAVNHALDSHHIERHYHIDPIPSHVPVTVLEQVDIDGEVSESDHRLVQTSVFTARELVVSRSRRENEFEILAREPLV